MTTEIKGPPTEPGNWCWEYEDGARLSCELIRFDDGSMVDSETGFVRCMNTSVRGYMSGQIVKSWRLDAPASPAWITDVGRLKEFVGKRVYVKWPNGCDAIGKVYMFSQFCCAVAGTVVTDPRARFCEIQLPEEPLEPQLPPHLEDIQVCSIGIPDGIVPIEQLDAVRERARKCYNALAGVDDVEGFVAAAKERG